MHRVLRAHAQNCLDRHVVEIDFGELCGICADLVGTVGVDVVLVVVIVIVVLGIGAGSRFGGLNASASPSLLFGHFLFFCARMKCASGSRTSLVFV